jgi:hypothetical protein
VCKKCSGVCRCPKSPLNPAAPGGINQHPESRHTGC